MRYPIEPRDIYVKGYGFLSFAKNIVTHATKVDKSRAISIVKNFLIVPKNLQQVQ